MVLTFVMVLMCDMREGEGGLRRSSRSTSSQLVNVRSQTCLNFSFPSWRSKGCFIWCFPISNWKQGGVEFSTSTVIEEITGEGLKCSNGAAKIPNYISFQRLHKRSTPAPPLILPWLHYILRSVTLGQAQHLVQATSLHWTREAELGFRWVAVQ